MRGSAGGGGGALLILAAQNPGAALAVIGAFAAAVGVYTVVDHMDQPNRAPIVADITADSARECANFHQDAAAYKELKDNLMRVWSSTLKTVKAQRDLTICTDSRLGDVYLPYKNENQSDGNIHNGEYRVAAVVYSDAQGHRTVVTKPESIRKAPQSNDLEPDMTRSTGGVLKEALFNSGSAPKMDLGNGMSAQILLQRDGVYQYSENGQTHDEEGLVWAKPAIQQQTAQQYSMSLSTRIAASSAPSW